MYNNYCSRRLFLQVEALATHLTSLEIQKKSLIPLKFKVRETDYDAEATLRRCLRSASRQVESPKSRGTIGDDTTNSATEGTESTNIQMEATDIKVKLVSEIKQYAKEAKVFRVGREGGICFNNQCGIILSVPEDALPAETLLYLGEAKTPAVEHPGRNYKKMSQEILCGPDSVTFIKPVYLTFKTTFLAMPDAPLPELYTMSSDGRGSWEKIDGALFSMLSVSTELDHFSRFTVRGGNVRIMTVLCYVKKIQSTIVGQIFIADSGYACVQVRKLKVG